MVTVSFNQELFLLLIISDIFEHGSRAAYCPQGASEDSQGYRWVKAEQVKEYTKEINGMRREYNREKIKLEYQGKTLQKDLKRKIEKKEPAVLALPLSKPKK